MDIYWGGQALFKIKGRSATVIIDPFDPNFTGLKLPKDLAADIAAKTHDHNDHNNLSAVSGDPVLITGPGEYDIKGVLVTAVGTFHDGQNGAERGKNTVYNVLIDNINVVHLGDLGHTLTQDQLEEIGNCDILMVPVGGVYTIDAKEAAEVVSQLEPKIILPMHYRIDGLKFPLAPVADFLKEMGLEAKEPQARLTIARDRLPDEPEVVLLSRV